MAKRKRYTRKPKVLSFSAWLKRSMGSNMVKFLFVATFAVVGIMMLRFSMAAPTTQTVTITINGVSNGVEYNGVSAPTNWGPSSITVKDNSNLHVSMRSTGAWRCLSGWTDSEATSASINVNIGTKSRVFNTTCHSPIKNNSYEALTGAMWVFVESEPRYPPVPGGLKANAVYTSYAKLSWKPVKLPSGPGTVKYKVKRYNTNTGEPTATKNVGTSTSFTSTGLKPSTTYYYAVCAYNTSKPYDRCTHRNDFLQIKTNSKSTPQPTLQAPKPKKSQPKKSTPKRSSSSAPKPSSNSTVRPVLQGPGTAPNPVIEKVEAPAEPPSEPQEFVAKFDEVGGIVKLNWMAPEKGNSNVHYVLSRSTDNKTWDVIESRLKSTTYSDTDTIFKDQYFYKLRAVNASGQESKEVKTKVATGEFQANVTVAEGGEIESSDGTVTVKFPPQAVTEDVQCSVVRSQDLVSVTDSDHIISGPFEIACKTSKSVTVEFFDQPLDVTMQINPDGYTDIKPYSNDSAYSEWSVQPGNLDESTLNFSLENGSKFVAAGKLKTTPIFVKILLGLGAAVGLVAVVIGLLYIRYRHQQKAIYDDYVRRSRGY